MDLLNNVDWWRLYYHGINMARLDAFHHVIFSVKVVTRAWIVLNGMSYVR